MTIQVQYQIHLRIVPGKEEESKTPVETPKTIAPIVDNLLKTFNKFSLSTFPEALQRNMALLTKWLFN